MIFRVTTRINPKVKSLITFKAGGQIHTKKKRTFNINEIALNDIKDNKEFIEIVKVQDYDEYMNKKIKKKIKAEKITKEDK